MHLQAIVIIYIYVVHLVYRHDGHKLANQPEAITGPNMAANLSEARYSPVLLAGGQDVANELLAVASNNNHGGPG